MLNPLVSIVLLAYNQETLITAAVESLLAQTYSPLEIILSDDSSTDNTFAIMQALANNYQGEHILKLNKNTVNLGICGHLNYVLQLTQGELIFHAAGDDISLPERCAKVVTVWLAGNKQADLIATDAFDMAFNGEILSIKRTDNLALWQNIEDWLTQRPFIFGASHAWSRRLIEGFGAINPQMNCEDQTLTFRALLTGTAITIAVPLMKHRRGGLSEGRRCTTVYQKRQKIIDGNLDSIVFFKQCIMDVERISIQTTIVVKLKQELNYRETIDKLFKSDSLLQRIAYAWQAKCLSPVKRVRFFIYAAFPGLLNPFFIKNKI